MNREDQLALKNLAATENQVADTLNQLQEKLRDDAKSAEKLFPKAAQSGRDLADKISEQRMEPLASQATGQMLAGDGEQSFQLADRLRNEMEKLFGECQGGNCPSGDELDSYLKLQRMKPGNNFAQMARSRKFGFGRGRGEAGTGEGMMGTSGYAVIAVTFPRKSINPKRFRCPARRRAVLLHLLLKTHRAAQFHAPAATRKERLTPKITDRKVGGDGHRKDQFPGGFIPRNDVGRSDSFGGQRNVSQNAGGHECLRRPDQQ